MRTILFVCTGNTCRSPMAECMFNALCERMGRADMRAVSAGVCAVENDQASGGARRAMSARGLSLAAHRSHRLTEALLREAALVVGMSQAHIDAVRAGFPRVDTPMRAFAPAIGDPYGADDESYRRTAEEIALQLPVLLS